MTLTEFQPANPQQCWQQWSEMQMNANTNMPSSINTLSDAINRGIDRIGTEKKNVDARMVALMVEAAKVELFDADDLRAIANREGDKDEKNARFTRFLTEVMGYETDDKSRLVDPSRRYGAITQTMRRCAPVALRIVDSGSEYELTKGGKLSIPHRLYASTEKVEENGERWADSFTPVGGKDGVNMSTVQKGCNEHLGIKVETRKPSDNNDATTLNKSVAFLAEMLKKLNDENGRLTREQEQALLRLSLATDKYIERVGDDVGEKVDDTDETDESAAA